MNISLIRTLYKAHGLAGLNPAYFMYLNNLLPLLRTSHSILDLGCSPGSPARYSSGYKVGLDGFEISLERARASKAYNEVLLGDVRKLDVLFPVRRFDAVVALDLIEHLEKADGFTLLNQMEAKADRIVVIVTPNGFVPQTNPVNGLQEHVSGWTSDEFIARGYKVIGLHGWKALRNGADLKFRPKWFWSLISLLSQTLYARRHPEAAGHLLCYKYCSPDTRAD